MKYQITFKHTVVQTFTAIVEAETVSGAKDKLEEDPYVYVEDPATPDNEEGVDLQIFETREL